jgi:hypothetical protein
VKRIVIKLCYPSDARGWIGLGCYLLVVILLAMMWADKTLLRDDFFKVIATAIILTGWNQGPVGWAYQATKSGGELADKNAEIVKQQAAAPQGASVDRMNVDADQVTVTDAKP